MDKPLDYIFIDTSILKMESYFKESGRVTKLFDLASKGYVKILLPIITKNEWLKHIKEATNVKFDDVERKILLLGNVKEASSITENLRQFSSEYLKFVEDSIALQLSKGNVIEIDYDFFMDTISEVFNKYFNQSKPFGSHGKNKEFPDAFVLASLEKYACKNSLERIVVFSVDKDMSLYESDKIVVEDIGKFLDNLVKNRIPSLNQAKQTNDINALFANVKSQNPVLKNELEKDIIEFLSDTSIYSQRFGYVDIDDVSNLNISLDITAKDIEIISISEDEIEAICFPEIDGCVSVKHFSEEESVWDSEDKAYLYETYVTTQLEISSYVKVTLKFYRNEFITDTMHNIQIEDIDYSSLKDSIDHDYY